METWTSTIQKGKQAARLAGRPDTELQNDADEGASNSSSLLVFHYPKTRVTGIHTNSSEDPPIAILHKHIQMRAVDTTWYVKLRSEDDDPLAKRKRENKPSCARDVPHEMIDNKRKEAIEGSRKGDL